MAMGILRSMTLEQDDWKIESAGVWARGGFSAHHYVELILQEKKIDLSQHRSRPITNEIIDQFNLILVMEKGHKEGLKAAFPQVSNQVFLLSEMVNRRYEIIDPIGGGIADFKETAQEIERILETGFARIRQLASSKA
jgi:protein-tyrosine phosphatase